VAPNYNDVELRTYRHQIGRGLEEFLARGLVEEARRLGAHGADEIEEAVKTSMRKQMAPAAAPWLAEGRRTLALVGPTGVGKTTAIAKIAARALLETRFKVALITVDTYRVGASDQLARYGKIMGIPTHVARDRAALADGINRFQDADLVLIDTAGRSDNQSLAEQTSLLRSVPQVELQLVLSAASGGRELGAIARRYRAIAPERMILTKLDEVDGPAGIYSALSALARPVSCISDGQRVPEDIHAVTGPDLVRIAFGN
jgi:flagellar biosynthesis protein FlhF